MADKWIVHISYSVAVDALRALDPDEIEEDYNELRTRAVLKMWTDGYGQVKDASEIEYENITEEFND